MVYKITVVLLLVVLSNACETIKNKQLTKENNGIEKEDCLVSRTVQTDAFLKDIEAFKEYTWNDIKKEATVPMPNGDTLVITHGGCIHFLVAAEFQPQKPINFEKDAAYIFNKILWVTKLLKDFKYDKLEEAIQSNSYQTITNKHITTLTFTDKELQEKFYAITINSKENKFSISQFLE